MFSKLFIFCHNPFRNCSVDFLEISINGKSFEYLPDIHFSQPEISDLFYFIVGEIITLCRCNDCDLYMLDYIRIKINNRDYYFVEF